MIIKVERSKTTKKIDCITICPESQEEVSLLNAMIDNKINLKTGVLYLLKEDRLKGRKVELSNGFDNENTIFEEYIHK